MVKIASGKSRGGFSTRGRDRIRLLASGMLSTLAAIFLFSCLLYMFSFTSISTINDKGASAAATTAIKRLSSFSTDNTQKDDRGGWKSIDVFYGDHKHLPTKGRGSQCHQDLLVASLLREQKNGYFVDLAANDAVNLSNTYRLEQLHQWTGICIEPNAMYWAHLAHRRCHVAAAVVGKDRMAEVHFRTYRDMWRRAASGGIDELIDPSIPKSNEKPIKLFTVTVDEILERYDAPSVMEYLSLDIEGAEYLVMKDFPFDRYKFKVMTVERPSQELTDLLFENGYLYLAGNNEDGMETAWIHIDFRGELDVEGGVEKAGWIGGKSTKWMAIDEASRWTKPLVNDLRLVSTKKL